MIETTDTGVYLLNGTEIIPDHAEGEAKLAQMGNAGGGDYALPASQRKEKAKQGTISYGILTGHSVGLQKGEKAEALHIRFDKLTSHDITYVGIIQTARASGLERFPIPYVLTNCHNSLCAVGGTINEDDHLFLLQKNMVESMCLRTRRSFTSLRGKCSPQQAV